MATLKHFSENGPCNNKGVKDLETSGRKAIGALLNSGLLSRVDGGGPGKVATYAVTPMGKDTIQKEAEPEPQPVPYPPLKGGGIGQDRLKASGNSFSQLFTGYRFLNMNTNNQNHARSGKIAIPQWQEAGSAFVRVCEANLWAPTGQKALTYLHSLGLEDAALKEYRIGFNPVDSFEPLPKWGFPPEYNQKGNLKKVRLPHGISIPCFHSEVLHSVKIRQYLNSTTETGRRTGRHPAKGLWSGAFWHPTCTRVFTPILVQQRT